MGLLPAGDVNFLILVACINLSVLINGIRINNTQSQASRQRLKRVLKAKIETDAETKSKHQEEKLSN